MSEHNYAPSELDLIPVAEDLTPQQRRLVHNAVVNNAVEGWVPSADAIADLSAFASGAIDEDQHRARVLARFGAAPPATPGANRKRRLRDRKTFDANHLRALHFYLFDQIYPWAGQYRNVEISKVSRVAPVNQIASGVAQAATIIAETPWDRVDDDEFCDRLAACYSSTNWAHAFREGSGRSTRIFMTDVATLAGRCLDYGAIRREVFIQRAAVFMP